MNEIDIRIDIQRQKAMQDEAANERLIQSLNKQNPRQGNLRERIGRSLMNAGEQLLKR